MRWRTPAAAFLAAGVVALSACSGDGEPDGSGPDDRAADGGGPVPTAPAVTSAPPTSEGARSPETEPSARAPCVDAAAPAASTTTRDAAYGEAVDLVLVDNAELQDDILELVVAAPEVLGDAAGAALALPPGSVGWQVEVDARQISGSPAVSVYDLRLSDARGRSCTLHSVGSGSGVLAPGEAQRVSTLVVFAVPEGPADGYELSLLDPRTREVLLRWR